MEKRKSKSKDVSGDEYVFLEKLECLAALGMTGQGNELTFFILGDLIKVRRLELKLKEG